MAACQISFGKFVEGYRQTLRQPGAQSHASTCSDDAESEALHVEKGRAGAEWRFRNANGVQRRRRFETLSECLTSADVFRAYTWAHCARAAHAAACLSEDGADGLLQSLSIGSGASSAKDSRFLRALIDGRPL